MDEKASKQYKKLRGRLLHRGYTVLDCIRALGLNQSSTYAALRGERNGKQAHAIRARITRFIAETNNFAPAHTQNLKTHAQ